MITAVDTARDDQTTLWCTVWNTVRPLRGRTPAELRYEADLDARTELWLVHDISGRPVGAVRLTDSRWTAAGEPLEGRLALVPSATAFTPMILDALCGRARRLGAQGLQVECRDVRADAAMRHALETAGFVCGDKDVESTLDVTGATERPSSAPAGIRVATLASRPDLAASAHRCFCLADADEPTDEAVAVRPLHDWVRDFESPWTSFGDCLLAVTDNDEVVGWASLERFGASPDVGWNGFTGTHPDHRRRGLAGHLKLAMLAYARQLGLRELRTENHVDNVAMLHLNARMGYIPSHINAWWRIDL